ncbi:MAG TPA: DNA-processing protein DprA [Mycobacteriales bacterium]|nr:DNA-processing protein DprA [Mycobacteriales bacterium]
MSDEERLARAALTRVSEPGHQDVARLVRSVGVITAWAALRSRDPRVRDSRLAGVALRADVTDPERDLETISREGGRLVCPGDAEWPEALDVLVAADCAPFALWVRGSGSLASLDGRAVAVVGTRAASEYGLYVAGELGAGLADRGWVVVSGGAYGIDGAAHRGCLVAEGATVAVLACGVDVRYPSGHARLFDRIRESGLLVSEHPPGAQPFRTRFLQRNRLIAALGLGTVVVEAGVRSGALSTAAHAARLGRMVMAVPGQVTESGSAGCHRLIRDVAATLVRGIDDVVEAVGRLGADLGPEGPGSPSGSARDGLPAEAARVLDAVPVRRAVGPEQIAVTAGFDPATVLGSLGLLAGLGLVERSGEGWRLGPAAMPSRRAGPRFRPPGAPNGRQAVQSRPAGRQLPFGGSGGAA